MKSITRIAAALLALTTLTTAHAQSAAPNDALSGTLRIVGTDTMKDLLGRWIAAFTALHPNTHIDLTANGALTAAPALADDAADLVPLGRELTPSELAAFRAKHRYDPTAIPVALGSYDTSGKTVALAIYVNASNPITHLTFQQLDAIYCTTLKRKPHKQSPSGANLASRANGPRVPSNPSASTSPTASPTSSASASATTAPSALASAKSTPAAPSTFSNASSPT